tara:strand:- start:1329 stop:1883 length:555 start_codon:yes stop_codon:yes gene_type:complete
VDPKLIKIANTTLLVLKDKTWEKVNLVEVLKKAKIKNLKNEILNKHDLLKNIILFFDFKLQKLTDNIDESNKKDMVFEIMMLRFDILQNYRKEVTNIFNSLKKDPKELIFLLPSFLDSMILMAELSKISSKGIKGRIKIKGLLLIYFSSFLIWLDDGTESLEKTMSHLDSSLEKADNFSRYLYN